MATLGEEAEEKIIAVGRYARLPRGDAAELALVVEDAYQRKRHRHAVAGADSHDSERKKDKTF